MPHRSIVLLLSFALGVGGCPSTPAAVDGGLDAPGTPGTDAPIPPGTDAPIPPGTDAPIPPGTDAPLTDAPATPPAALCRLACSSPSDCTTASAAFDADNYDCEAGGCVYRGCNTDTECRSSFADARYVCRDVGAGIAICTLGCAAASDCTTASAAFDADNYECRAGACVYVGCRSAEECRASFADARYTCR